MSDPREAELLRQIQERDARLKVLEQERSLLQQRIDQLLRQIYGTRSEKVNPDQLQLLLQGLHTPGPGEGKGSSPETAEAPAPRPRDPAPHRTTRAERRLPEHLPVIEEIIVPLPVQANPTAWRRMGEEVTERLDFEPARFFRRRIVRPKYVHRQELDAVPITAPLPACILERSIATAGLVAQILVAKYVDHLPLYRQQTIYRSRHGVGLSRQLMGQWIDVAADWLKPIYHHIRGEVLVENYVQIDETPVQYLAPGHGKTKTGYFWTMHRGPFQRLQLPACLIAHSKRDCIIKKQIQRLLKREKPNHEFQVLRLCLRRIWNSCRNCGFQRNRPGDQLVIRLRRSHCG